MAKRWLLVGVMLLASLLVVGCGVPQEEHDAVVAGRDAAKAQVSSLQSDLAATQSQLDATESDLRETQSQISSLESEVSSLQSIVSSLRDQVSSLTNELDTAERTITELRAAATEEAVTPTPIAALSKDYSKYGFGFDYPKGFSVTEIGMLQNEADDKSGIVQVGKENDDIELFQAAWVQITESTFEVIGLHNYMDESFAGMEAGAEGASIDRGELVETTKAGHLMIYQYYTSSYLDVEAYGIVAVFYCDVSQRAWQLMTVNTTISAKQDVLEDFMNYLDSFVCH